MLSSLLIALLIAVISAGAASTYLWRVHRHRLETAAGLRIVAGMRWREFSGLVVDALRGRGFEPDSVDQEAHRGHQADLLLRRDGQTWLLVCKQGVDYRITAAALAEFSRAMRFNAVAGGLMATPGRVDAEARRQAGAIELIGGIALWPLLRPLLPVSVRDSIAAESHALSVRYVLLGWLAALVLGVGVAWMLPTPVNQRSPAAPITAASNPDAGNAASDHPVALASAPLSEKEQRQQIAREVSGLPGIDRALWSTRSTLLITLEDEAGADPLRSICAVVERYDGLRASRLQLQPAAGSQRSVRFLQCRVY